MRETRGAEACARRSGLGLSARPLHQPTPDRVTKSGQIVQPLEIAVHFIPIYAYVLMNEDVTEAGQGCQLPCEVERQNVEFTKPQDRLVVVARLFGVLQGNDPMADVNAALGSDFQIALYDVPEVGIPIEFSPLPRS